MIDIYELKLEKTGEFDYDGPMIADCPEDIYNMIEAYGIRGKTEEHMYLLAFDKGMELLGIFELSRGSVNGTRFDPSEVLKRLLVLNSADFAIVHNHLAKEAVPSREDLEVTAELYSLCQMMDVLLMDHIITCKEKGVFYSMRDQGFLG